MVIVLRAGRVARGHDLQIVENGAVVVDGDRITEVGHARDIARTESARNAEVVDLGSGTLLPGFVDPHSHLGIDAFKDEDPQMLLGDFEVLIRATHHARTNLLSGVTTMRLLGERKFMDVVLRDLIERNVVPGPRLLVSGPALTATNGFGAFVGQYADGPDEIRRVVRRNLREGADVIKLFVSGGGGSKPAMSWTSYYSIEEIRAAVEESHKVGKKVAAHIHGGLGIKYAIEAGVDTIEHAHYIEESDCKLMAGKEMWLVFTLSIIHHDGPEVEHHPNYIIHKNRIRALNGQNVARAHEYGVRITAGTDAMHGLIGVEAEWLTRFGLGQREAIQAITISSAEACGVAERVGSIEAGKLADIVGIEGDPFEDISALRRIQFVMKGGTRVDISSN